MPHKWTKEGLQRVAEATKKRMLSMTKEERIAFAMQGVEARRKKHPKLPQHELKRRSREARLELRKQVMEHYGGKCQCCKESNIGFLTIDHIDGGGRLHRKNIHNLYRWLRIQGFPPGFQVLCYNCNCSKGILGACPHLLTRQ